MKLKELIEELQKLANQRYMSDAEVVINDEDQEYTGKITNILIKKERVSIRCYCEHFDD